MTAMSAHAIMDDALDFLAPYGPDLRNGLTNHAPMAIEALCAVGRGDAVLPWLERYRKELLPRPALQERITPDGWRGALGRLDRTEDWRAFFVERLAEEPWGDVVGRWTARLAPGLCASATHGVIRTAHAVRALDDAASRARIAELAEGLGYWAANYQTLPTAQATGVQRLAARDAIARVRVVPEEERRFTGTIVSSLEALDAHPDFPPVIDLLDADRPPDVAIADLTETFARVYLANARDVLTTIVFVHGVTSASALRLLVPHLDVATARDVVRYGWQTGAALYAAFGTAPPPAGDVAPPPENAATLVDRAIANGDEHAIKLTEACLREHAVHPSAAYLAAARHAIGMLPPA